MDENGIVKVYEKDKFTITIDAIALPENAIFLERGITQNRQEENKIDYPLSPPTGKNIFIHSLHRRSECKDFSIKVKSLAIKDPSRSNFLTGKVGFTVEPENSRHQKVIERENPEIYAFIDGEFIQEIKADKLPINILIDTTRLKNGPCVMTINLRTIEDHVGTYTFRANIMNP